MVAPTTSQARPQAPEPPPPLDAESLGVRLTAEVERARQALDDETRQDTDRMLRNLRRGILPKDNAPKPGLIEFARAFGRELSEYDPYEQKQIIAARELLPLAGHFSVAHAFDPRPSNRKVWVEEKLRELEEKTKFREVERPSDAPSDNQDVGRLERLGQLPALVASEWLKEEVAPDQFLADAAGRKLLIRRHLDTTADAFHSTESVEKTRLVEKPAPPEKEKIHGYVILDRSGSMGDDSRLAVARAMSLAFFYRCYEENARLKMRSFDDNLDDLVSGEGAAGLTTVAAELFSVYPRGDTDIDQALRKAVADICHEGAFARANIVLISDGLSELGECPLKENTFLHTILIGRGDDPDTPLRAWSKTFLPLRLSLEQITDQVSLRDEAAEEIHSIPDRIDEHADLDQLARLASRLDNAQALLSAAQRAREQTTDKLVDEFEAKRAQLPCETPVKRQRDELAEALKAVENPDELQSLRDRAAKLAQVADRLRAHGLISDLLAENVKNDAATAERQLKSDDFREQLAERREKRQREERRAERESEKINERIREQFSERQSFWRWLMGKLHSAWGAMSGR